MATLFIRLLVILSINKQALTLNFYGVDLSDIKQAYNFVSNLYTKGTEVADSYGTGENKDPAAQLKEIIVDLKGLSKQLTNIQIHQDEKLDSIVSTILDNIEVSDDLRTTRTELNKYVNDVEYWYNTSLKYDMSGSYSNKTIKAFIKSVLWNKDNLQQTLFNIYRLIFPNANVYIREDLLSLTIKDVQKNYERLCDRYISSQQRILYSFVILIQTELKAFAVLTQAYSMQFIFDNVNYADEYTNLKDAIHTQLTKYIERFIDFMDKFPRDVRRCDVINPQRGKNVIEFERLFQVAVENECRLREITDWRLTIPSCAWGTCEDIQSINSEGFKIYNCKTIVWAVACPAEDSDIRFRYLWWKTSKETMGHNYECPNTERSLNSHLTSGWGYNSLCMCSVALELTQYPHNITPNIRFTWPQIIKVSVQPQLSNVGSNMVVVGVRFILYGNALHLQIKQAKLSQDGFIGTVGEWKPVNVDHTNRTIRINYSLIIYRRSIIYLDDIDVMPNFIVTGVRLVVSELNDGFKLNVHGTEYNYQRGQLGSTHAWFIPGQYPVNPDDYKRKRTEIKLNDPDDPTLAQNYHPDPESNKFVRFQLSSIKKDAGYHTVPFIDAQPVETSPDFPLSGVGLFYRGRDGFGGYIAPRLFTFNVVQPLNSSYEKWKIMEQTYKRCDLDVPVDITSFNETAYC